jgi:hypothetical protein
MSRINQSTEVLFFFLHYRITFLLFLFLFLLLLLLLLLLFHRTIDLTLVAPF